MALVVVCVVLRCSSSRMVLYLVTDRYHADLLPHLPASSDRAWCCCSFAFAFSLREARSNIPLRKSFGTQLIHGVSEFAIEIIQHIRALPTGKWESQWGWCCGFIARELCSHIQRNSTFLYEYYNTRNTIMSSLLALAIATHGGVQGTVAT